MSDVSDLLKSLGLFGGIGFLIGALFGIIIVVPFYRTNNSGGFGILVAIPAIAGAVIGGIITALLGSKAKQG